MPNDKSTISTGEDIARGSESIGKKEEFDKLLDKFPDNPYVNRLFADFQKRKRSFGSAIERYVTAYELFMAAGETLLAIAALIELWEIVKPTPHEFRILHSQLRRRASHASPIAECFATMSYPELRATIPYLKKVRLQPDEIIHNPGDREDALYFIISGELIKSASLNFSTSGKQVESPSTGEEGQDGVVRFLKANDHFGDDYPFEIIKPAPYQVKATSEAELLKITKEDFLTLCGLHPDLENGVRKLIKYQLIPEAEKPDKFSRKTSRAPMVTSLSLYILNPEPGRSQLGVKGFSTDISLGGTCVIVDPKYQNIPLKTLNNKKAKLRVSLPDESISISIMGTVAWCRRTEVSGHKTCAIGVKFTETPPRLRASMVVFVSAVGSMTEHPTEYNLSPDEIEAASNR
jgi:CRP-like cAMP-binding protein